MPGIDVSHYQGQVDWPVVAASGVRFAFIRASHGSRIADTTFGRNWAAARAAGLARGAYHFYSFCQDGPAQARHFLALLGADHGELPPVVDVEYRGNCAGARATPRRELHAGLAAFAATVAAAVGQRPLLYTTPELYLRLRLHEQDFAGLWLQDFAAPPALPGVRWDFWQYRIGRLPGLSGPVDCDLVRGDWARRLAPPGPQGR